MGSNKRDHAAGATDQALAGILVIDKPLGRSSMSAVAEVRRKARGVKTGHAGTLDPLATGVLVLALGRATRVINQLMDTSKRYRTVVDLSAFTTTDDREGEREEVAVDIPPSRETIEEALQQYIGEVEQRPPAYSAVKIKGTRAYKLARSGKAVEMPPRRVTVHDAQLVDYHWPLATIELHTAKGFYVRSFARDLGISLATGGHCAELRRTAVGPFTIDDAVALDDVPQPVTQGDLIAIDDALAMVQSD